MIVYVETSVLLRIVFHQQKMLAEWDEIVVGVTSELTRIEALRTFHRYELTGRVRAERVAVARALARDIIGRLDVLPLRRSAIRRAAGSFPTPLGTLDALHLATANLYRNAQPADERPIRFATHDLELARAARELRFDVIGI